MKTRSILYLVVISFGVFAVSSCAVPVGKGEASGLPAPRCVKYFPDGKTCIKYERKTVEEMARDYTPASYCCLDRGGRCEIKSPAATGAGCYCMVNTLVGLQIGYGKACQ